MKILLDNGHGKNTKGKRSPLWKNGTQLLEWEFNRDIVSRIATALDLNGISYEIIVPEDIDVALPARINRINDFAEQEDCFLISVHANAGGGTGWEVFTSPGDTKSDEYASVFFDTAHRLLPAFRMRPDRRDGDADKEANFRLLSRTTCPAILTENLFMDNRRDCKFLLSNYGRQIIADLHVESIQIIIEHNI